MGLMVREQASADMAVPCHIVLRPYGAYGKGAGYGEQGAALPNDITPLRGLGKGVSLCRQGGAVPYSITPLRGLW
jgi:hypothetical protein